MATYIPGITDYIPQVQPFKPDFNFLNNVLQFKQNKYDQNYKAISQKYGALLNSPMMRADNIEKRNEFFKMIDNDIKRMSGMDLSLQQNVDSANTVFDSFLQNKDLVYDMTFTKQHNKQKQIGLNYKGKDGYWDEGLKFLDYKAKEYQNASKEDAMNISPGEYVPKVDIQGEAKKYITELFNAGKGDVFGIEQINYSPDGRYQIKLKNGKLLDTPLQTLLMTQFADDPRVKSMFYTKAYVDRESYIEQNLEKFGGNRDAAEDDYFTKVDFKVKEAKYYQQEMQKLAESVRAKKAIIEKQIKKRGTSGTDDLAKAYEAAGIDVSTIDRSLDHTDEIAKIADSLLNPDQDRDTRRRTIDAFMSNSLLKNKIIESSDNIARLTGSIDIKEDPYHLKEYDHSLKINELITQSSLNRQETRERYALEDQLEKNKRIYDISAAIAKGEITGDSVVRGSLVTNSNKPTIIKDFAGTTTGTENSKELEENQQAVTDASNSFFKSQNALSSGYTNTLLDLASGKQEGDANEVKRAQITLQGIWGTAKKDQNGKVIGFGYDPATNSLYNEKGQRVADPESMITDKTSTAIYKNALAMARENKDIDSHSMFLNGVGKNYMKKRDLSLQLYTAANDNVINNNKVIKNLVQYDDMEDKIGWDEMFTSDSKLKSRPQFVKDYIASMKKFAPRESIDADDASDKYDDYMEQYNKTYYSSPKGIKSWYGTPEFQMLGGGKTAGNAFLYSANTKEPGSDASRGLLGIYTDALNGGIFTFDNQTTVDDAEDENNENAKLAMQNWIADLRNGVTSGKNSEAFSAELYYMDLALSDPNYAGALVKFPEAWIESHKAKKGQAKTWADDPDISKGVGVYFNKKAAKNDLTESFRLKPYDILINHAPVKLSDPKGGDITIGKRKPDGTIEVHGNLFGYPKGSNKLESRSIYYNYTNDPGGETLVTGLEKLLETVSQANKSYEQNNFKWIYDPEELPNVQRMLYEASGEQLPMNPIESFSQNVSSVRNLIPTLR